MRHEINSAHWADERRWQETRELLASIVFLIAVLALAIAWVGSCDVRNQITEPAPLPCEMASATTGHCPQ